MPPRAERSRLFEWYVRLVCLAGAVTIGATLVRADFRTMPGRHPLIFWVLAGCLTLSELRPIKWLRRSEGGEVTASWTFAFALLLVAPPAGALLCIAAASLVGDLTSKKPFTRAAFNAAQVTISLAAGAAVLIGAGQQHALLNADGPTFIWLPVAVLAAGAAFILNGLFTCTVLALYRDVPVWPMVKVGVWLNLSTDGMLLALAPIFVVVGERSLLLLPLLVITAWAVYRTSNLALERQHDANHDQLTGLSNRRVFREEVEEAILHAGRREQVVAVVLLDLDGFKAVNDQLGHHIGDLVLKEVATRLDDYRRATDGLARLGGDEFGMILPNDDAEAATVVATRLLELVEQPCVVAGFPVSVSGSFGIAVYPHHGTDVDTLIQHADVAMYLAKNTEQRVQTYNGDNDRTRRGRFDLLGDLQGAIDAHQLVMHYQPKVDLRTGDVTGVEALVRWQHPTLGLVPPDEFIGLAEHTDLIEPLTDAVLDLALAQLSLWHQQGIKLTVAVNGSARNLHDLSFPGRVETILRRHGVDPHWLELEITENTVVTDPVRTAIVLRSLRDMGVQLAIDDFGTGYSSLAHLRQLPVHIVKIDRSFVSDMLVRPEDGVVVRSIIDLAHNLGMTTTAEGVEDSGVLESLTLSGCDGAQGYVIARPTPPADLTPWLRERFALRALAARAAAAAAS